MLRCAAVREPGPAHHLQRRRPRVQRGGQRRGARVARGRGDGEAGRAVRAPLRRRRLARPHARAPAEARRARRRASASSASPATTGRRPPSRRSTSTRAAGGSSRWTATCSTRPRRSRRLVAKKDEGYDVVYGVREGRQGLALPRRRLAHDAVGHALDDGDRAARGRLDLPPDERAHRAPRRGAARAAQVLQRAPRLERRAHRDGAACSTRRGTPGRRTTTSRSSSTTPSTSSSASRASRSGTSARSASSSRSWASGLGALGHRAQAPLGLRLHGLAVALRGGRHPRRRAAHRDERHRRVHRAHLRAGAGAAALQHRRAAQLRRPRRPPTSCTARRSCPRRSPRARQRSPRRARAARARRRSPRSRRSDARSSSSAAASRSSRSSARRSAAASTSSAPT